MRGVSKTNNVEATSSSAVSSEKILKNTNFYGQAQGGLFDGINIGDLKKSIKHGGVQTEGFTSDGYVFQFLNYGTTCSASPFEVLGLTINTCVSDESGNSYIYTCNEKFATKTKYSGSSSCSTAGVTTQYPLGCTTEQNDDDYAGEDYLSLYVGCSTADSTLQIPDSAKYAVNMYYSNTMCSGGAMSYKGLINNVCIPSGTNSYRVVYPNINYYQGKDDCSIATSGTEQIFRMSCGAANLTSFDDDNTPVFTNENGILMTGSFSVLGGNNDDDSGPSDGAIAGVVIGCVVGVGLLFACIFWVVFFRKSSKGLADQQKN